MFRLDYALASAEATDLSGSDWLIPVIVIGVIAVIGGLALVPIAVARYRLSDPSRGIITAVMLWALLLAGSVVLFTSEELKWSKERRLLINTGYYDPLDNTGAPAWPWKVWLALAVAYCGLVLYCLVRTKPKAATKH